MKIDVSAHDAPVICSPEDFVGNNMKQFIVLAACFLPCLVLLDGQSVMPSRSQTQSTALASSLELPFHVPNGTWQFTGHRWTFGKTVGPLVNGKSADLNQRSRPAADDHSSSNPPADRPDPLDDDLLVLIRNWMKQTTESAGAIHYSVETSTLQGTAMTRRSGGREVPQRLTISLPAYDDLWTTYTATRTGNPQPPAMLQLPPEFQITATRLNEQLAPWCHFVSTNTDVDPRRTFRLSGWTVESSDRPTEFSISRPGAQFDVSIIRPTADSPISLLIRIGPGHAERHRST